MEATMKSMNVGGTMKMVVTLDPEAFRIEVQKYIDMSPVASEWNDVLHLKWPEDLHPPQLWHTFGDISKVIKYACASVEVAKQKVLKEMDPDGSKGLKFDNAIALGTAVEIISSLIHFQGPSWLPGFASLLKKFWKPALNIAVSVFISQQTVSWPAIAIQILQVVLV